MSPGMERDERRKQSPVAIVVQHVAPEGPGLIADVLGARGTAIRTVRTWLGEPVPQELAGAQALVVMGGPMGVYDADQFPHLRDEARLIELAIAAEVPVLGVCLGSQLLASVLGAKVVRGPHKEIGWHRVDCAAAAAGDALFSALPAAFVPLHWHGDVFDLPKGAVGLASSDLTRHQAFRYGRSTYGILFHLEITRPMVEEWVQSFADELSTERIDAARLLAEAGRHLAELAPHGQGLFERFAALSR